MPFWWWHGNAGDSQQAICCDLWSANHVNSRMLNLLASHSTPRSVHSTDTARARVPRDNERQFYLSVQCAFECVDEKPTELTVTETRTTATHRIFGWFFFIFADYYGMAWSICFHSMKVYITLILIWWMYNCSCKMFKNYSLCEPRVISTIQLIVLPLYIFHYHYYFWFFFRCRLCWWWCSDRMNAGHRPLPTYDRSVRPVPKKSGQLKRWIHD